MPTIISTVESDRKHCYAERDLLAIAKFLVWLRVVD